jgi:hypothetical protein
MTDRDRKVLILGASGYERAKDGVRVDCVPWVRLQTISNLRDYDTVIFDLLSLKTPAERESVDWTHFYEIASFRKAIDVPFHGGSIVTIGDPRFAVHYTSRERVNGRGPAGGTERRHPFLIWSGLDFTWDSTPGDTIVISNDYGHRAFVRYLRTLRTWTYALRRCEINESELETRFNLKALSKTYREIEIQKDILCKNRYAHALAFEIRFGISESDGYQGSRVSAFGPLIFLPETTLSTDEAIQMVLQDICNIPTELPEPKWLEAFSAPGQAEIDTQIVEIQADIREGTTRLQKLQNTRTDVRQCLKLLYEREYALEPVARGILRTLGAEVEDPIEKNKEDGWIRVSAFGQELEGVLEIKSTKADHFTEDGRKQLLDWIDRGRTLRGKNYKGLFIGNGAVEKPIGDRVDAFSDSWKKSAALSGISAIKTEHLYAVYLLQQKGLLESEPFWKQLFETNGVFDASAYLELLCPQKQAAEES